MSLNMNLIYYVLNVLVDLEVIMKPISSMNVMELLYECIDNIYND